MVRQTECNISMNTHKPFWVAETCWHSALLLFPPRPRNRSSLLHSFYLCLVIFPAFSSSSFYSFSSSPIASSSSRPHHPSDPSRSSSLPHYLPGWPQRSVRWANLSWIIWSAAPEHPLSSCVSCSHDHPASLFTLSLSIHLSLVLLPPSLISLQASPSPWPPSVFVFLFLFMMPSFSLCFLLSFWFCFQLQVYTHLQPYSTGNIP